MIYLGFSPKPANVLPEEIANVAETIKEGISIRGIYLLMYERLDLICGPGTIQNINDPEVTPKIAEFAAAHGWSFTRHEAGFVFWPDSRTA